jgi:alkylation response protein AidB-like acyl-CoA dehydrogenase
MDFSLTDDQSELQAAVGRLFDEHAHIAAVRAAEPIGFSADLWRRLGDLGIPDMAWSGATDGAPATMSQLIVVAEEYGRRLAPVPLLESVTAIRALDRAGIDLPEWGIVTIALRPADPSGSLPLLSAGAVADGAVALIGDALVLTDLDGEPAKGFLSNLGSSPIATRSPGAQRTVLCAGAPAHAALALAVDDWKVLLSAALVGLAGEAHRITVAYVKERKAFGVPIGWFQTVAHHLADSINDLDGARFLVHKAAWAIDNDDKAAGCLTSMAYSYATSLVQRVTAECLHFHGGIGYTLEHDIQLYFRRAAAWPLALGDPRAELATLSTRMFGERRKR